MVVGLADMRDAELRDGAVRQGIEQTGGLQIAEMAEVAGDAALQARRIRAATEQLKVMVELQDQRIAILKNLGHMGCHAAGIRQHPQSTPIGLEQELTGLACIVRDGIRANTEAIDPQGLSLTAEQAKAGHLGGIDRPPGPRGRPDLDAMPPREGPDTFHMVAMLVGQEQDIDAVRLDIHRPQTLIQLAQAEAVVHQHKAARSFHKRGIAAAAAAERAETHVGPRLNRIQSEMRHFHFVFSDGDFLDLGERRFKTS
jgi:hypothetical protein